MSSKVESSALVWAGVVRDLRVEVTTVDAFQQDLLQGRTALAGTLAAAVGLSGIAAGMVAMSMHEMREKAFSLTFQLGDNTVRAVLWGCPFQDGDEVEIVAERDGDYLRAFAVLRPKDRVVALFPHVVSGRSAHNKSTFKVLLWVYLAIAVFASISMTFFWFLGGGGDVGFFLACVGAVILAAIAMFSIIGWSVSRKYLPFVMMAENIFSVLGWSDVGRINLREQTMRRILVGDPPELGPFYFKY